MRKLRSPFLICSLAVLGLGAGYADSLTEYFNYGVLDPPPTYNFVIGSVPSEGQITLNTNGDGTITATLTDYYATINMIGFNFNNSCANGLCVDIGDSSSTFNARGSTGDAFGDQHLAFWCDDPTSGYPADCGMQNVTWTISSDNESFTSVYQLLGGTSSLSDFWLSDNNYNNADTNGDLNGDPIGQYGAGMPPYGLAAPTNSTVTPEPSSFLLMASGLAGMLGAIRRKLRA
ncbi:MAG TPA: PEP-CTERM sorting domain-containing protein [Terracidiphilus sp.]|jgi:hypothetical protein|nr:PEP-CTERM sorting domain-containing protein [Terracidiphilus sp.]